MIEVIKVTSKDGQIYYNADHSPDLIAVMLKRLPSWKSIELIEMSKEEYFSLPTTNEAAELWRL